MEWTGHAPGKLEYSDNEIARYPARQNARCALAEAIEEWLKMLGSGRNRVRVTEIDNS